jgi:hypothetical protein
LASKQQEYDLNLLLYKVKDFGFAVIFISEIWRLLDKWSRAAGTWRALLDAWEELDKSHKRTDLHIFEVAHEYLVISRVASEPITKWAGEQLV